MMKALITLSSAAALLFAPGPARPQDIWEAVRGGDAAGVKAMIEKDPRLIGSRTASGMSLLHVAVDAGNIEMTKRLVGWGIRLDDKNIYGWTPLHLASERGAVGIMKILLEAGAGLDERTIDGRTAFHLASEAGKSEAAELLLSKGCSKEAPKFPEMKGEYFGQPSPGRTAEPFALPMLAAQPGYYNRSITFSPDGSVAYWPVIDLRDKLKRWIVGSRMEKGVWTRPQRAAFSKKGYEDDVPCLSPSGKKLLFLSQRPLSKGDAANKENVWSMTREGETWSDPVPLPGAVNSFPEIHQQVSLDGEDHLYFGGQGQDGYGSLDLYVSKCVSGEYQRPVNLGPAINGPDGEYAPFISPDGSYLIFTRNLKEGWTLFISFRGRDGTWTPPVDLRGIIKGIDGTNISESFVTRDGRYLIFFGERDETVTPYWIDTAFIESLRKKIMKT